MFSINHQLNEGGCINNEKKCAGRKLFEGQNPKYGYSTKQAAQVNSHWEKLRK